MTAFARRRGRKLGKLVLGVALVGGLGFSAAPAFAQFGGGPCSREDLQKATDSYIAAQTAGDTMKMSFGGEWIQYNENLDTASMLSGILSKPLKIDFYRSILDPTICQSFTEVIVTDPAHPYVIGAKLNGRAGGKVGGFDMFITDQGDWLFNAANTLKYSKAENWGVIPEAERDSRETIIKAADAYLDLFDNKNAQVPWGSPCARLEGGAYTGKGAPGVATPEDSCNVGVPSGVKLVNRNYVVDPTIGAVAVMLEFGTKHRPDVHTFRIEHGKIRYVHTITVCEETNCGFPQNGQPPAAQPAAATTTK